jgi:type VI secretion system protein ImpB
MARESIQKKISRVRPPRVHISYDVETGGAIEKKELPFVVGVLADLAGTPEKPLPKMKDRKFVEIDRDNFDQVMERISPRATFRVDNKLTDDDTRLNVELRFRSLADFEPQNVVKQIEPLRALLELRSRLSNLRSSLYGNDRLDSLLQEVLHNTESWNKLRAEVGVTEAEPIPGSPKES